MAQINTSIVETTPSRLDEEAQEAIRKAFANISEEDREKLREFLFSDKPGETRLANDAYLHCANSLVSCYKHVQAEKHDQFM
jgi:hypothetical protein